jgi:Arc/MetJ family transcription regulator
MKTTLNIDNRLLAEARRLTRIEEKTALIHAGLEALIARARARRMAALGGSDLRATPVRRRRSSPRGGS